MSQPTSESWFRRNDSRIRRLRRLRSTESFTLFFPDNQPETGVIKIVVARKEQEIFPRNLAGRGVKDCLEMPGSKQTLFPTEVLTHLQCRIIKLPDAHDLWRDDATERHDRSW